MQISGATGAGTFPAAWDLIPARGGMPDHVRAPYSSHGPDRVLRNGSAAFHALIEFFLQHALELGMQEPMRCYQDLTVLVELNLVRRGSRGSNRQQRRPSAWSCPR